jgi:NAD(P)-dependent dehydrogenase (short-subunit alcohol dehydrogenase family)
VSGAASTLAGKTILVTGGARGLGRSIVEAMLGAGADVIAVGRSEVDLARLRNERGGRVQTHAGDVRDPAFAERVLRSASPHVVILNAGVRPELSPIDKQSWRAARVFRARNISSASGCR